jgi:hypothetical protein
LTQYRNTFFNIEYTQVLFTWEKIFNSWLREYVKIIVKIDEMIKYFFLINQTSGTINYHSFIYVTWTKWWNFAFRKIDLIWCFKKIHIQRFGLFFLSAVLTLFVWLRLVDIMCSKAVRIDWSIF